MFDPNDPVEILMWRKLAMNLLYAMPSKNVINNYTENRANMEKLNEPPTPVITRSDRGNATQGMRRRPSNWSQGKVSEQTLNKHASLGSNAANESSPNG